MQNSVNKSEIDLSNCTTTEELVNGVIRAIDTPDKPLSVDLKLDNTEINQSQMIFIKSLIESYGSRLVLVRTQNEATLSICKEVGIETSTALEKPQTLGDYVLKSMAEEEEAERKRLKALEAATAIKAEREALDLDIVEMYDNASDLENTKKQVISVYRKADEEEKRAEFKEEENVDFYATPTDEPIVIDSTSTIYINQTLRSGQILEYDGNVVIIGDCHPGSEIKATGDITVWGVLGSIAHAGAKGNAEARIRALKMNAVQLRIADCYSRRPDQGNIPYIVKSSVFTPEEARIVDDNIVLFKLAQD